MRNSNIFISPPDYCRFPLDIPECKSAFVTVNAGKIKEIEIHYENGGIQTIRPDNIVKRKP
jgi:hypothetical protein